MLSMKLPEIGHSLHLHMPIVDRPSRGSSKKSPKFAVEISKSRVHAIRVRLKTDTRWLEKSVSPHAFRLTLW